jgi:hypothetical protein
MPKRVAMLASNDTQVRMYEPVYDELRSRGVDAVVLSLDRYYQQDATWAAQRHGLSVIELGAPQDGPSGGFYRRGVIPIWRDVLAARQPMERFLRSWRPDVVMLGNDFGLLEKLCLDRCRRARVRQTILLQDGRLSEKRSTPDNWGRRAMGFLKAAVSPVLRAATLGYFAASEYGQGGADTICATGAAGATLLRSRARGRSEVHITGQPRYDNLIKLVDRPPPTAPRPHWVYFTTPFRSGRTRDLQLHTIRELSARAIQANLTFTVKPHPRESPQTYRDLRVDTARSEDEPSKLLAAATGAIIGTSTVVEEAGLLGRPVIVPGSLVHGSRFPSALPPVDLYPRFESIEEAITYMTELSSGSLQAVVVRQSEWIRREVDFQADHPAAARVADIVARHLG